MDILFRYAHFLGIILTAGTLMAEVLLVKKKMTGYELRRMSLLDAAYGISILILVTAGLLLWFKSGKPSFFYSQNPIFVTKIVMVAIIGILSIYPTVYFIRNRKLPEGDVVDVPDVVRRLVMAEMSLLLLVPLLAVLMARGVGLRSF